MVVNHTSSTNRSDIDAIWASLISAGEPLWLSLTDAPADFAASVDVQDEPYAPTAPVYPLANDWDIDERPIAEIEADYQQQNWAAPAYRPTPTDRRRIGRASVAEVLADLQACIDRAGGLSWYQLTSAVKQVGGDDYKVGRIAEELAEAGAVIIERPRRLMAGQGAISANEQLRYENIARVAFVDLAHRTATWLEAAAQLKGLRRKITPELRPRILEYYTMHRLNRTNERMLFAELELLRQKYPGFDPVAQRIQASADSARLKSLYSAYYHCHKQGEKAKLYHEYWALREQLAAREVAILSRWRSLPEVAAIYDAITSDQMWVVARIALRYQGRGLEFDDLFQEGYTGLLHAVEAFRPMQGKRFVLCLSFWVKQHIRRAIELQGNPISLPAHMWERYHQADAIHDQLVQKLGRLPYDWEVERAAQLKHGLWGRLNAVLHVRPIQRCPTAKQVADSSQSAYDWMWDNYAREVLAATIDRYCTERNRIIVGMRLNPDQGFTLEQIASKFSVTRERVRQIVEKFIISRRVRNQICWALQVPRSEPKQESEKESNDA